MFLELNIEDDTVTITGNVYEEDASFDHAFGCEKRSELVVENLKVETEVCEFEVDITNSLSKHAKEYFEDKLKEFYIKENPC